jgi:hypothetical protein
MMAVNDYKGPSQKGQGGPSGKGNAPSRPKDANKGNPSGRSWASDRGQAGSDRSWTNLLDASKAKGPNGRDTCKFGKNCREVLTKGLCKDWHPKEEFKIMLDKFKAKNLAKKGAEKGEGKES